MLGKSHLLLGAAGYMAGINWAVQSMGHTSFSPAEVIAGTLVAAGASMLPDLDHPQATASRSLGFVTQTLSRLISTLAGGHRQGTHSLLATLAVFLGSSWILEGHATSFWAPFILMIIPISLVPRVAFHLPVLVNSALSVLLCLVAFAMTHNFLWLPYALTGGYLLHIVGDMLTPEGAPLIWPLKHRTGLGLFETGTAPERGVAALCGVACVLVLGLGVLLPLARANHPTLFGTPSREIPIQKSSTKQAVADRVQKTVATVDKKYQPVD